MKHDNIIVITPHFSYGDSLSMIGLLYYLLDYYEKVFYFIGDDTTDLNDYYTHFFLNDPLLNKRIFITTQPEVLINEGEYGDYHICSLLTYNWAVPATPYIELPNINSEYYFNDLNPIFNKLDIPENHKTQPNSHYPNKVLEINHIFYYKLIGLNNTVRMDYFNYKRNLKKEVEFKNHILSQHGLNEGDKYTIVNVRNDIGVGVLKPYIDNEYPIINLSGIASGLGIFNSLVEGADTIHLVEGTNTLFLYQCQYKHIINTIGKTYYHVWVRPRKWPDRNMNLDFSWKISGTPMLDEWVYLFDQPNNKIIKL